MRQIVTAGELYTDIDVLACALSYASLLNLQGLQAEAVLPAPLNVTVAKSIGENALNYSLELKYDPRECEFIIVDISNTEHYAKFVPLERVVKVFDHHFYDDISKLKKLLGNNAVIEHVGACATLIWEEYKKEGFFNAISPFNALLLYSAILSNTLDFKASVTTERDKKAAFEIESLNFIPKNWKQQYYSEIEEELHVDPEKYMQLDTKKVEILGAMVAITQLELWDSKEFLAATSERMHSFMKDQNVPLAFITSPCISEGRNYFVAMNPETEQILHKVWPELVFQNGMASSSKLYLRKEILPKLLDL